MAVEVPAAIGKEEEPSAGARAVLDQSSALAGAFDQDILADIEDKLDEEDDLGGQELAKGGEKVELDRADLPLDDFLPADEQQAPPEPDLEVDLSDGEEEADDQLTLETGGDKQAASKLGLIVGASLLVLALGAGGVYWYLQSRPAEPQVQQATENVVRGPIPQADELLRLDLQPFIIPLQKSPEGRLLRVKISLEAMDPEGKNELTLRTMDLRDVIYRMLRDRPAGELKTAKLKRALQSQLKTQINEYLGQTLVNRVFFLEFVITG